MIGRVKADRSIVDFSYNIRREHNSRDKREVWSGELSMPKSDYNSPDMN